MPSDNHGLCKVNIVFYFNDRLTDFMCSFGFNLF